MNNHTRSLKICLSMLLAAVMTACTVSASSDPPHEGEVFAGWALNDDEENLYDTGTKIGINKADEDYTVKLKAVYTNPTAVLYNDGSLIFYESTPDPEDKNVHLDIAGGPWPGIGDWATEIYDHSEAPWGWYRDEIVSVQFKGHIKPKSTAYWFYNIHNMETFISDGLDTSNVQNMKSMFNSCNKLTNISKIDTWDTSQVTDMSEMFYYCSGISDLNIGNWDVSNVTDMNNMFYYCSGISDLNIGNWDVSNVTDMNNMFYYCSGISELNIGGWNVSNVINMSQMFRDCKNLQKLDLSNWSPTKVENIEDMFRYFGSDLDVHATTSIFAQDWTFNQNINNTKQVFFFTKIFEFLTSTGGGDMCKPQSMGGYFTDPI